MTSPEEVGRVAAVLREQVLILVAGATQPPAAVRMAAGGVTVEVDWTAPDTPVPASVPAALAAVTAAPVVEPGPDTVALCAETVGVFYLAPEPGAGAFVAVGEEIRVGQQVGIVEAMKLIIPVEATRAGRVAEFLVADGTAVEYGQPLLLLHA